MKQGHGGTLVAGTAIATGGLLCGAGGAAASAGQARPVIIAP